jgi:hypothetical protein
MVNSRETAVLSVLTLALAVACVSSPVLAPAEGQIILSANPTTINLDEFADPPLTEGTSLVSAQVLDSSGIPQPGVTVIFSTNGGRLASAPAGQISTPLQTDDNGFVADTLTVQLGDPDSISVTVRSGSLSAAIAVEKAETQPNRPPLPLLDITPQGSALLNSTVIFDATGSSDPDGDAITCYQWQIEASSNISNPSLPCVPPNSRCEVSQGASNFILTRSYSVEQVLAVTLRVTDDPAVACSPSGPTESVANFGGVTADSYEILCDRSAPNAGAGANQTVTLGANPSVSVALSGATSFDSESGIVSYEWNCGNGTGTVSGSSVICVYNAVAVYVATLTVTNGCGMTDVDDVVVTVN